MTMVETFMLVLTTITLVWSGITTVISSLRMVVGKEKIVSKIVWYMVPLVATGLYIHMPYALILEDIILIILNGILLRSFIYEDKALKKLKEEELAEWQSHSHSEN